MKHNYIKEYQNIRIRPLNKDDLELLRRWRNMPINTRYLSQVPYITPQMQLEWFDRNQAAPDEITFAIDEIDTLNRLVGSLSLYNINNKEAEFGKMLIGDEEAHGKKVGVYSIVTLLSICFNLLNLQRVFLHVFEENISAVKVYKEVRFEIEKIDKKKLEYEYTMVMSRENFLKENEKRWNII